MGSCSLAGYQVGAHVQEVSLEAEGHGSLRIHNHIASFGNVHVQYGLPVEAACDGS